MAKTIVLAGTKQKLKKEVEIERNYEEDIKKMIEKLNKESSFGRGINGILKQALRLTPGEEEEIINKISEKTNYKKIALRKQLEFFAKEKKGNEHEKIEERESWTPALNDETFKIIHPALDFSTGICYVGTRIPCKSSRTDRIKLKSVLITENGEILPLNSETLTEKNIELETEPMEIKPRWSFKSIDAFVKNPKIINSVNITELFTGIRNQLIFFVYFEEDEFYDILACWVVGTYFYYLFDKYPYFQLKGVPGSGKSKTAKIVGWMSFNGKLGIKYSESSVFRNAHSTRGTMIIDENEALGSRSEKKQNIEDLLNSGFEKGFSVPRIEKVREDGVEKFINVDHEVYCPKFVANIKGISKDSTSERTIEGTMIKCGKKREQGKHIPEFDDLKWQTIRDDEYYCLFKYWKLVKEQKEKVKEEIENEITSRDLDIWLPILTVSKLVGDGVYNKVKKKAEKLIEDKIVDVAEKSEEATILQILLKKKIFEDIFNAKLKNKGYDTYLDDDINKTPRFYIKDITNYLIGTLNWNKDYTTQRSIGRKITTLKCFAEKGNDGIGIWYKFTPKRLQEIKASFGWDFKEEDEDDS